MMKVRVNARGAIRAFGILQAEVPKQLRSALDKSARAARTAFLTMTVADLRLKRRNMSVAKGGVTEDLHLSRGTRLSTFFRPARKSYNLSQVVGVRVTRNKGVQAEHNVIATGGSSHLNAPKAFAIGGRKGRIVNRVTWGPGTHRSGYRAMRTTTPAYLLGSTRVTPMRKAWEETAAAQLTLLVPNAIGTAIRKAGF